MVQEMFSGYFPLIAHALVRSLIIFVTTLGLVYMLGRMLGILNTPRSKNAFALTTMVVLSYWSILIYDTQILVNELEIYWRVLVYASVSTVLYVLIGFDLYDRFNAYTDKKFVKAPRKKIDLKEKE